MLLRDDSDVLPQNFKTLFTNLEVLISQVDDFLLRDALRLELDNLYIFVDYVVEKMLSNFKKENKHVA